MKFTAKQHFAHFTAKLVNGLAMASYCPVMPSTRRAWSRTIVIRGRKTFGGS